MLFLLIRFPPILVFHWYSIGRCEGRMRDAHSWERKSHVCIAPLPSASEWEASPWKQNLGLKGGRAYSAMLHVKSVKHTRTLQWYALAAASPIWLCQGERGCNTVDHLDILSFAVSLLAYLVILHSAILPLARLAESLKLSKVLEIIFLGKLNYWFRRMLFI